MIKKQSGVTLIELMISMVLGLSLVAGIGQLFIQSQKSFKLQRNVSDATDDASFILETVAKGLVLAGYSINGFPGRKGDDSNVLGSTTLSFLDSECIRPNPEPYNTIDTADPNYAATTDAKYIASWICEYIKGTDNELIYRYQLDDASSTGPLDNFLCTQPLTTAAVSDIVTVRFYKANDSNGIPVFYCQTKSTSDTTHTTAQPLVSDVAQIIFKYGIQNKTYDTAIPKNHTPSLDTFYYTTAANVTDWKNVFSVKMFIVLRSNEDHLTRTPMTYSVDGTSYTATDNRIYKVFSKTIFLRGLTQ